MTGQDIVALRGKLDMTQAQLAKALGVSQGTVSEWEADKKRPRAVTRLKIERLQSKKGRKS